MRTPVFVGSAFVAQYPEGGGNFWVPLQWVLGLRDAGIDAVWYELLWTRGSAERDRECIDAFLRYVGELGVEDRIVLLYFPDGRREDPPGRVVVHGANADALLERRRDALLLNLAHSATAPLRAGFARTALFDIDPGTFQLWARDSDLGVGMHDHHLTIGMHLGEPDCPVPLGDVAWTRVWPCVHLPSWPRQPAPPRDAPWTTITQWWSGQYAVLDGAVLDCNKRAGFLPLLPLAQRTRAPLELAANIHPGEVEDRALLASHGWRLVDPVAVAGTPLTFRNYVQRSRGEVSAAKPAYVVTRPGWISDRTLCYLASGRPCLVEATGAEVHLPISAGLRFFASLDEAVDGLRALEGDPAGAARAARALAQEVFATDVVVPRVLTTCGV